MSFEIIFVFGLLAIAFILFATDYVSFDITALILLLSLVSSGILSPREGLAGFSNPATITVAAMFILSEGLRKTGVLNTVGDYFTQKIEQNFGLGLFQLLLFVSVSSAFINNTAVVVIFIPVMMDIAARIEISPSKLLMPLSFAGIFGGICTFIGTSTNILVSSIAEDRGLAPFSMFEFSPMGLILLGSGFLFMFTIGIRMIPNRRENEQLTTGYEMQEFLTDIIINPTSNLLDEYLDEEELTKKLDLDVIRIFKPESNRSAQRTKTKIEAGDTLRIRGSASEINKLLNRNDFTLKPTKEWMDVHLERGTDALVEAVIAPESPLQGKTLSEISFAERYGAVPLAIRHHGQIEQEDLDSFRLSGGDTLLLSISKERIQEIDHAPSFVVASEADVSKKRREKTPIVLSIIAGVVAAAAFNIVPIVVSAIAGVILLMMTQCLTTEEAYNAVNWKVIILLAGVIPLGTAMDKTGAANLLANQMIALLSDFGPRAVLSGFFLLTTGITAVMSNNASAALLAPIAIESANSMGIDPHPLLFAVTFAASLSFITPFGYQTNTLIYGAGQYKFTDFTKIGLPLNILFWILATIFIPIFWPF
ncbi:Di- and tricarboxylate transporter [Fodinibius salinus]|uniref:Di-and tricarboxylate transporter n=1 Tax=Fodinibius salinus TaxID=860790 RepID=A0A5D3YJE3_9BACT|nr:SLC13 family permease [Fodinibius salinus]TYP93964.1 Di- and tricarboxylate transporter [Fodinibius salinus]